MPHRLVHIYEGILGVLGAAAAGVLVIGGTGGFVTRIAAVVTKAAESSVIVGLLGFSGVSVGTIGTIIVAFVKRDGDHRGEVLAQMMKKLDALDEKLDGHTDRLTALEARVPDADARGRAVHELQLSVARIEGTIANRPKE